MCFLPHTERKAKARYLQLQNQTQKEMRLFTCLVFLVVLSNACRDYESNNTNTSINDNSSSSELFNNGNIEEEIKKYQAKLISYPKSYNYNYNYACLLSKYKCFDSSYKYLRRAIIIDTLADALTDPDFLHLREDKNWNEFEDSLILKLNIKLNRNINDIDYAKKLWRMKALDQSYYDEIEIAEKKVGMKSSVVIALWDLKDAINKKNQKELLELIAQKGWPKKSNVGEQACASAFLIIQHSNLEYQEKYLPVIKTLCEQGEASWADFALMYDRILTENNRPQKYGSQIRYNDKTKLHELFPLENKNKVDEWRKEVGLIPLKYYVKRWNIELDSTYKK